MNIVTEAKPLRGFIDFVSGPNNHEGAKWFLRRFDAPVKAMDTVDQEIRSKVDNLIPQKDVADQLVERINNTYKESNIKNAEAVHSLTVITGSVAAGVGIFNSFSKLESTFVKSFYASMFGLYSGLIFSKIIEKPVRTAIDSYRSRQQKKDVNGFLKCELGGNGN